ncbi:MAG: Uma2 family endonuclease [Symploca sp. SIO2G7]|nr:Uma2 family endonuclease [Symploca sp. SIO2G7]
MYDLPSEYPEEPGLPDQFHDLQPQILSRSLQLSNYKSDNCFSASDLNVYYDLNNPLWHKRPDWFLALDVPHLYEGKDLRRSYVVWQEGKNPNVVIEFLSPGTEVEDLGRFYDETAKVAKAASAKQTKNKPPAKLEVYEKYLQVPHYIVYSRYTRKLRYFKLEGGEYQEQSLNPENPMVWLADLEIGLGIWEGVFQNAPGHWLRWCDREGNWLLTDTEQSEQRLEQSEQRLEQSEQRLEQERAAKERERAAKEQERAAKERERAAKEQERAAKERERAAKEQAEAKLMQTARNLLETGMEIEQVAQIMGLSEEQLKALQSQH